MTISRLVTRVLPGIILSLPVIAWGGPEIPGEKQKQPVAIVGATIHPVVGDVLANGTILFDDGRLTAIGAQVTIPANARRIQGTGKHVYPGLFDAYTQLGLIEIESVRATLDAREPGYLNPNVRSWLAVNPDSDVIPVTRSNGVLLALAAPTGGLIAGQSGVLQLDGWTNEEMTLAPGVGLHVDWPPLVPDFQSSASPAAQREERSKALERIEQAFEEARAYLHARRAGKELPHDARWEAMVPLLEGQLPLIVTVNDLPGIQTVVALAVREKVKLVIHGGLDAGECAELLREQNVPVILGGVHRLPLRRDDDYDAPFTLPERLRTAGVRFCIAGTSRGVAANVRNLAYHASTAAAYGLPRDEALRSVTLYPAQILGVANRVGSLEPGKDATLFVATGDPLETDCQIELAFIQGRAVDLDDRHKRLFRKYEEKYRRGK